MKEKRVLPLSTYRDPNYESDSSFENYYLNYAEEKAEDEEEEGEKATPSSSSGGCGGCDDVVGIVKLARKEPKNIDLEISSSSISSTNKKRKTEENKLLCNDDDAGVRSPNRPIRIRIKRTTSVDNGHNSCSQKSSITTSTDDDDGNPWNDDDDDDGGGVLFTRRVLQNADMNEQQHRLSLPCKRVLFDPFTADESARLRDRLPVDAILMDPRGVEYPIHIRLTKAGPTTYCYGIGKPWLQIKDHNGFQPGMVLDIRVARRPRGGGRLCFSLHRAPALA